MANNQNLKPWPKGVSGNPSGRPRRKYLTDLVEELLQEKCIDDPNSRQQLKDARQAFRARKTDARRKIVVGAVVLAHAGRDPAFRAVLQLVLRQHITRTIDRELLTDLLS